MLSFDLADIGELDEAAAGQRDLRLGQLVGICCVAEHTHLLLRTRNLGSAAGAVHVAGAKLLIDLGRCDPLRLERGGIEDDADRSVDTPDTLNRGDPRHAEQPLGDRIVDVPAELFQLMSVVVAPI